MGMRTKKNRVFPIVITTLIIIIIIYLFVTVKQPYIECSKITTYDMGVTVREELKSSLDSNKISRIGLVKTITLPTDDNINSIKYVIEESYDYLGNKAKIIVEENKIIIKVEIGDDETVILNNISFVDNDGLQIKIDNNTKSSEVVSLKISDKYTEGELMTRMKNNGYSCK